MRLFDTLNLLNMLVWTSCAHSAITTHLTSMCLRCRQCPCLSAGWTYLHLSICLGLKGVTYKGRPMLQWIINIFYMQPCLCSVKVCSRLLLSGLGENFILLTGPTGHEISLCCFECERQKDRRIDSQVLFWRGIPFASVVNGMFLRLTC